MTQQSPDTLIDPNRAPTLAGVERVAAKVAALLPQTPLLPLEIDGRTIWCKAECLQPVGAFKIRGAWRSEEHTSELQSLMRISYAVFCLKKKKKIKYTTTAAQYE